MIRPTSPLHEEECGRYDDEDSDIQTLSNELPNQPPATNEYIGKDGTTVWSKIPPVLRRPRTAIDFKEANNIGPKRGARSAMTPLECFSLFITNRVIDDIVENTNIYIDTIRPDDPSKNKKFNPTDPVEIRALFVLLFMFGVSRIGRAELKHLWSDSDGRGWKLCTALMGYGLSDACYSFRQHSYEG